MTEQDGGYEYHARRQRRATVTIAIVLLALAGSFYYASTYFSDTAPTPGPCTTVLPTQALRPQDVSVNVYNATSRRGLASGTAKVLRERGFSVKAVANDPLGKTVKKAAEIRFGPAGKASGAVLAEHVPGAELVADKRKDDTVDLVLGNAWKALGPVPEATSTTPTLPLCPGVTSPTGTGTGS